jgi:predicted transcriptional regulator
MRKKARKSTEKHGKTSVEGKIKDVPTLNFKAYRNFHSFLSPELDGDE